MGDLHLLSEKRIADVDEVPSSVINQRAEGGFLTRVLSVPLCRRTYSARINGRESDMTVAVYQGQNAEEEWRRDVRRYSGVRHPNFLQVYGISGTSSLYATVFHDDLIPLTEIYLSCKHSVLATAYLDAYFGVALGDAETHINSISGMFLYPGSYTPWMRRSTGRLCVDLSPSAVDTRILPTTLPVRVPHIPLPHLRSQDSTNIIAALTVDQYQEIINYCHTISLSSSESLLVRGQIKLGSLVHYRSPTDEPIEIASIESRCAIEDSGWKLKVRGSPGPPRPTRMKNGWTRFNYSSNSTIMGMASRSIHWPKAVNSWLPQANFMLSSLGVTSEYEHYRIIYGVEYWLSFSSTPNGQRTYGYLFLCPLNDLQTGSSSFSSKDPGNGNENRFTRPPLAAYWSLDPSGSTRLTHCQAQLLGFPSLELKMKIWARSWDSRVYYGVWEFQRGKGWDPASQDVARAMRIPLYRSPWLQLDDLQETQVKEAEPSLGADRSIYQLPPTKVAPDSGRSFRRVQLTSVLRFVLCLLFIALLAWQRLFLTTSNPESSTITRAVHRAQELETWLNDDSLALFIDILREDGRLAGVYNSIQREGLRERWVRRQLNESETL
ncbi:hypothetical protein FB45DRAFT_1038070 [Roridomyces roridus]|uniref:Protein kinase domain-containing protein n=1 Tax=Roridomyces roridus TaxID=1738132 RepID=A0AAD7B5H7_9AGAR|nr:hypothetical protein FB45DRAFT_1038070 [Roridomyces roridus]